MINCLHYWDRYICYSPVEIIIAFQGKEFTPEMKQLIVNFKLHFDAEKRADKFVLTTNATERVAYGLGIGEATVEKIMAAINIAKTMKWKKRTGETTLSVVN